MYYTDSQVERVLHAIGLDIQSVAGDDYIVYCPYHPNYRTPAGEVSKERGTFYCFSCGYTTTLNNLVMKVSDRNYFEALRLINSKATESDIISDVTKSLSKRPEYVQFDQQLLDRMYQDCLNSDRAKAYWDKRLITADSIHKFKLGYSHNQDMVIVPVHSPEGMAVGFVARSIEGKIFKNSVNLPTSTVMFNLHRVKTSPTVVVVESSFDVIRLDQVGIPAVATLGAGVSNGRINLLDKYFNSVILVPDANEAGEKMRKRLMKGLGSKITSFSLPPTATDVGDLSDDQLRKLAKAVDDPLLLMV